ncbi:hypothetical protein BN130_418 [Cronobacter malonaticus 507]|nr:hypothetical protein BN130_418 [Cronobacter malonaticus 507]
MAVAELHVGGIVIAIFQVHAAVLVLHLRFEHQAAADIKRQTGFKGADITPAVCFHTVAVARIGIEVMTRTLRHHINPPAALMHAVDIQTGAVGVVTHRTRFRFLAALNVDCRQTCRTVDADTPFHGRRLASPQIATDLQEGVAAFAFRRVAVTQIRTAVIVAQLACLEARPHVAAILRRAARRVATAVERAKQRAVVVHRLCIQRAVKVHGRAVVLRAILVAATGRGGQIPAFVASALTQAVVIRPRLQVVGKAERVVGGGRAVNGVHDLDAVAGGARAQTALVTDGDAGVAGRGAAVKDQAVGGRRTALEQGVQGDRTAVTRQVSNRQGFRNKHARRCLVINGAAKRQVVQQRVAGHQPGGASVNGEIGRVDHTGERGAVGQLQRGAKLRDNVRHRFEAAEHQRTALQPGTAGLVQNAADGQFAVALFIQAAGTADIRGNRVVALIGGHAQFAGVGDVARNRGAIFQLGGAGQNTAIRHAEFTAVLYHGVVGDTVRRHREHAAAFQQHAVRQLVRDRELTQRVGAVNRCVGASDNARAAVKINVGRFGRIRHRQHTALVNDGLVGDTAFTDVLHAAFGHGGRDSRTAKRHALAAVFADGGRRYRTAVIDDLIAHHGVVDNNPAFIDVLDPARLDDGRNHRTAAVDVLRTAQIDGGAGRRTAGQHVLNAAVLNVGIEGLATVVDILRGAAIQAGVFRHTAAVDVLYRVSREFRAISGAAHVLYGAVNQHRGFCRRARADVLDSAGIHTGVHGATAAQQVLLAAAVIGFGHHRAVVDGLFRIVIQPG